ncbi:MAG: hypothetical protein ACRDTR_04935, partial [Rubrobacter sp.]
TMIVAASLWTAGLGHTLAPILLHGLIYGAVLSVSMSLAFLGIAYLNPEIWLNDYPPDIRERFGPMSERARKQRTLAGVPVFLLLFGTIVLSAIRLARIGGDDAFFAVFLGTFTVLLVFNLADLPILDWLVFNTLRPGFVILPGTEGARGYSDYGFHFRAFLKGVAGAVVVSLLVAGATSGIGAVAA